MSDVKCKRCFTPLKDGKIVQFLQDDILGTRIVIECISAEDFMIPNKEG